MGMLWSKSVSGVPELDSIEEFVRLLKDELVILFKHSTTCPVSWMAHREVMQYRSAKPETPISLVSVRRRRDISHLIAEHTGVQHESPQLIVLRRGGVVASASHDDITAEAITAFVEKTCQQKIPEPVPSAGS